MAGKWKKSFKHIVDKMKIMRKLTFAFHLIFLGCLQEKPEGFFKYYNGYYIGDYLETSSNVTLITNDTVFISERPVAKFIKIENRFNGDKFLVIESLETNERGMYIRG